MEEPKLIKTWDELKECTPETHTLEIEVKDGNGWIHPYSAVVNTHIPLNFFKSVVLM